MPSPRGRPNPKVHLEHQVGTIERKRVKSYGNLGIESVVIPRTRISELIAEWIESQPKKAVLVPLPGSKHKRLVLTPAGRYDLATFHPISKKIGELTESQKQRYAKRFILRARQESRRDSVLRRSHVRQGQLGPKSYSWKKILEDKMKFAQSMQRVVEMNARTFERRMPDGKMGEVLEAEVRRTIQGWKNLADMLKYTIEQYGNKVE